MFKFNNNLNYNKIKKYIKNKYIKNSIYSIDNLLIINDNLYKCLDIDNKGSYGKIKQYVNEESEVFISKSALDEKSNKSFEAEIKIHSILSSFQDIYFKNKNNIIPRILFVYQNENKEIFMEKYEDDIYHLFVDLNVSNDNDKYLFLELLFQIATHLRILQKHFNFMHNDLKTNNIFFTLVDNKEAFSYQNVNFIIGDLGGSTIMFEDNNIVGEVKGVQRLLIPQKDIFMLVHIILTFIRKEYKESFILLIDDLFSNQVNKELAMSKDNKWHELYTLKSYPNIYHPKNVLKMIKKKYPNFKS